jgi:sigma-70-like protein
MSDNTDDIENRRRFKRCIGACDQVLPNSEEFFAPRKRGDRGGRTFSNNKCRKCIQSDQRATRPSKAKQPEYEMTFQEIAEKLGMSHQGVINIYNKAIEKMRHIMQEKKP